MTGGHLHGKKLQKRSISQRTSKRLIVLYDPAAFPEGFQGYLHTNGYAGYHKLPEEITVVGCWAHARRKFDEALKSIAKGHASAKNIRKGLDFCNRLFAIEQKLANLPAEERYNQRLEKAKPVLGELFRWFETVHYSSKSPWGSAMEYLKSQKTSLLNYLLDGRLKISNNCAECSIKPFVIDRKNFLFTNTPGGAQGSAVIFSLIQTAIENGLDPWRYLTWLIDMAAKGSVDAEGLFPWVDPVSCRGAV